MDDQTANTAQHDPDTIAFNRAIVNLLVQEVTKIGQGGSVESVMCRTIDLVVLTWTMNEVGNSIFEQCAAQLSPEDRASLLDAIRTQVQANLATLTVGDG